MISYRNCIMHKSSEGQLLIGEDATALVDCGMAFCAEETVAKVADALKERNLDYILMTHTHYDHIGALPYFRKTWPNLKVVTCEVGAAVLLKDTPRRVIRELSVTAAKTMAGMVALPEGYSDDAFYADEIVKEGDVIDLGLISVRVLETPGHTRDALSFYIPELYLLILSETPGVLMPDGSIYPCFLTGYESTQSSIDKCRSSGCKTIALPHRGMLEELNPAEYFQLAKIANSECREFILRLKSQNLTEEEMLEKFYKRYATKELMEYQPKEAFMANAKATINAAC